MFYGVAAFFGIVIAESLGVLLAQPFGVGVFLTWSGASRATAAFMSASVSLITLAVSGAFDLPADRRNWMLDLTGRTALIAGAGILAMFPIAISSIPKIGLWIIIGVQVSVQNYAILAKQ